METRTDADNGAPEQPAEVAPEPPPTEEELRKQPIAEAIPGAVYVCPHEGCGEQRAVAAPPALMAMAQGATIGAKCKKCGRWLQVRFKPPEQAPAVQVAHRLPNRHERRLMEAQMRALREGGG